MKYYLSPAFKHNPSFDSPMLLKLDKTLNAPNNWISLNQEQYSYLINQGYKTESIKTISQNNIIEECYNYYYPKWIHSLINSGACKYIWFKPSESHFLLHNTLSFNLPNEKNKFILECKNDIKKLGRDILTNGTYFPFVFNDTQTEKIKVYLGFHRIYSLSLLKTDKEFLGIYFPFEDEDDFHLKVNSKTDPFLTKQIPFYILDIAHNKIFIGKSNNLTNLNYFFTFSDDLAPLLYNYKNIIKPNPIWNNKTLFEKWINQPFLEKR